MSDEGPRGWGRPLHAAVRDPTGAVRGGRLFDVVAAVQLLMHVAAPVALLAAAERARAVVAARV